MRQRLGTLEKPGGIHGPNTMSGSTTNFFIKKEGRQALHVEEGSNGAGWMAAHVLIQPDYAPVLANNDLHQLKDAACRYLPR
jgi:hypothetical protein